jgi:hypothetical protein
MDIFYIGVDRVYSIPQKYIVLYYFILLSGGFRLSVSLVGILCKEISWDDLCRINYLDIATRGNFLFDVENNLIPKIGEYSVHLKLLTSSRGCLGHSS